MEGEEVWNFTEDFFFLFFFFSFFLSAFETTEVCLGCTKMENFTEKKHISCREKNRKSDFASSEKYSSYATV